MSKAKTERYDVTPDAVAMLKRMHARAVYCANHGDVPRISSAEVLAVLRATQDERAQHAEEVARLEERLAGSCEAEELRSGLEKLMADRGPLGTDAVNRDSLQALLDKVDARDSLLTLETIDSLRDQLRKVEGERDALAVRMDLPASQLLMVGSELCGDGKIDPNDHRDPRWTPTLQQAAKVMRELTSIRALLPDVRACAEYIVERGVDNADGSARRILAALASQGGEGECLDRSDARGVAGDRCESGNECGRLGCPECQS